MQQHTTRPSIAVLIQEAKEANKQAEHALKKINQASSTPQEEGSEEQAHTILEQATKFNESITRYNSLKKVVRSMDGTPLSIWMGLMEGSIALTPVG